MCPRFVIWLATFFIIVDAITAPPATIEDFSVGLSISSLGISPSSESIINKYFLSTSLLRIRSFIKSKTDSYMFDSYMKNFVSSVSIPQRALISGENLPSVLK